MVALSLARVNATAETPSLPRFRFADDVESQAFGPSQHIRAVHPSSCRGGLRRGFIVWGQKTSWTDEKGKERPWKAWSDPVGGEAEYAAEKLISSSKQRTVDNLYFSMQAFRRPNCRKVWNLSALGCAYVDIDYKDTRWKGRDPQAVLTAVLLALDDAKMPAPSFVMDSGSGLHLIWLHNLVSPKALPRWNLLQDRLVGALKSFGSDPAAKDAARVLRLSKSWNPNASRKDPTRGLVRLIWIQGDEIAKPFRYDFDQLADEIMPCTRAEIISLRAERAKQRSNSKPNSRMRRKSAARRDSTSYAETVLEDLHRLRKHRYPKTFGRLPAGARDKWLFIAAMALSWITPAPALQGQIEALAIEVSGWRSREAKSRMASVIKRAQDAAVGKMIEFDGQEVDPRYRMKAETIIKWLSIEEDEMRSAGLRVLLTSDAQRERKMLNAREQRRAKGSMPHDERLARRIQLGKRAAWLHIREGFTYAEIAAELGVSRATVGKAMEEARRASSPTSETASKRREESAFRLVYGGIPPKGGTHQSGSGGLGPRTIGQKTATSRPGRR